MFSTDDGSDEKMTGLEELPLPRICVLGNTGLFSLRKSVSCCKILGVGKSSFCNSLCGLKGEFPESAKFDSCTQKVNRLLLTHLSNSKSSSKFKICLPFSNSEIYFVFFDTDSM